MKKSIFLASILFSGNLLFAFPGISLNTDVSAGLGATKNSSTAAANKQKQDKISTSASVSTTNNFSSFDFHNSIQLSFLNNSMNLNFENKFRFYHHFHRHRKFEDVLFGFITNKDNTGLYLTEPDLTTNDIVINTKVIDKPFALKIKTDNYNGPVILAVKDNTLGRYLDFFVNSSEATSLTSKLVLLKDVSNNKVINNIVIKGISQNSNFDILYLKNFNLDNYLNSNLNFTQIEKYFFYIQKRKGSCFRHHFHHHDFSWGATAYNYMKKWKHPFDKFAPNIDYMFGLKNTGCDFVNSENNIVSLKIMKNFKNILTTYLELQKNYLKNSTFPYYIYLLENFEKINPQNYDNFVNAMKYCYPVKSFSLFSNIIFEVMKDPSKFGNWDEILKDFGPEFLNNNITACQEALFNIPELVVKKSSEDNFAIRPYEFSVNINKIIVNGNNNITPKYLENLKTNPIPYVRAGDIIDLSVGAVNYDGGTVESFNDNFVPSSSLNELPGLNYNYTIQSELVNKAKNDNNNYLNIDENSDNNIYNGKGEISGLTYNEVGKVILTVKEKTPFAKVDMNEPGETKEELYIKPANVSFISIPFKYGISLDTKGYYKDLNGNYVIKDFVPLSNSLNEAGIEKEITIKGYNKNGNVTKYLDDNYFKPQELYINTILDNENIPLNVKSGIYNYLTKNNNNHFNVLNPVLESKNIVNDINFKNGVAKINLYYNFNRTFNDPVTPFDANIKNLFVSDGFVINRTNKDNNNTEFRYLRIKINNLTTQYIEEVPYNATYEYYTKFETWKPVDIDRNLIKNYRVPLNNYYKGMVDIEYKNDAWVNHGKQLLLLNVNTNIRPLEFTIHYDVPKWLWYNPLDSDNIYNFESNNCLYHPCNKISIIKILKNNNKNNNTSNDKTIQDNTENSVNPVDYIQDNGVKKFNY